jgi:hypothetical protein
MAGLVPAIHVGSAPEPLLQGLKRRPDVDPRDKPGDDWFFDIDLIRGSPSIL